MQHLLHAFGVRGPPTVAFGLVQSYLRYYVCSQIPWKVVQAVKLPDVVRSIIDWSLEHAL